MKKANKTINEAKDLQLYKMVIRVLGEYSVSVPCTGVDALFNTAIEKGAQIIPKDKNAIEILYFVFGNDAPSAINNMLNLRFSDLPVGLRPMIKPSRKHEVAFWTRDKNTSCRIKDLIDWGATGKQGTWTDCDGKKQEVIDMSTNVYNTPVEAK